MVRADHQGVQHQVHSQAPNPLKGVVRRAVKVVAAVQADHRLVVRSWPRDLTAQERVRRVVSNPTGEMTL